LRWRLTYLQNRSDLDATLGSMKANIANDFV